MRISKLFLMMLASLALATMSFAQSSAGLGRFNGSDPVTNAAAPSATTTFTTLVSFDGTDGESPMAALIQGTDGNFYGTTLSGGGYGTVYKITPGGTLTVLNTLCQNTCGIDGYNLFAPLLLATNGTFYGTAASGGVNGLGTVFEVTPTGTLTTLYAFCAQANCADGDTPQSALVQATDGNFYGTTPYGGANFLGTVFKMTSAGKLTTLYSFCAQTHCTDGSEPFAGLVQGSDGRFYGTTNSGGTIHSYGTVFKITPGGALTTLHRFDGNDGNNPLGELIQASDGKFYGTTQAGGIHGGGTVFRISSQGNLTTLYNFCSQLDCSDGSHALSALIQATDGTFYGTTNSGGDTNCGSSFGCGTLFKISPSGKLTTLHSFEYVGDGGYPRGALLQATDGNFYGTTQFGGSGNPGTVFSLSVGLRPFVDTTTTSGRVGSAVIILGNNLRGASTVTFNGIAATGFKVVSDTYMTAVVPIGATTGRVVVTTPSGPLTSNKNFTIIK